MAKENIKPEPGWEDIQSSLPDPWEPKKGDVRIGTYIGAVKVKKVDAKGKESEFDSYHFEDEHGDRFAVAGAMLSTKLDQVREGETVKITYLGKTELQSGRSAHDWRVQRRA